MLTSHGMWALDPNVMGKKTKLEKLFNKIIYSRLLKKIDAVIGLTDQITNFAKQMSKKESIFFTIPNGVNTSLFIENFERKNEYREKYSLEKESIVILFLGRFEQVKGIIEFAESVKTIIKNKKIEVLIVGGGSLENKIKTILKGIGQIHIFPWQNADKIHEFYIASDIFILPSRFEGLPLTIIEAMNAGLHIVYTPVGGIPEFIEGYPRKTILHTGSSKEIKNVLTEIITHYSNSVGKDIAINYARKFDWSNLAQANIKVYEECLIDKK